MLPINSTDNDNLENNNEVSLNIKELLDYILSGKTLPTKNDFLRETLVLLFVTLSGMTVYFDSSMKYAADHGEEYAGHSKLQREIFFVLGISISSLSMLYLSTLIYLKKRREKNIPADIHKFLQTTESNAQRKLQDVATYFLAAISSIPLAILSLVYPLPIPIYWSIALATIIFIDNTILHTLPIFLVFQQMKYGFPLLIIAAMAKMAYECFCGPIQTTKFEELSPLEQSLRDQLIGFLQLAQNKNYLDRSFHLSTLSFHSNIQTTFVKTILNRNSTDLLGTLYNENHSRWQSALIPKPHKGTFLYRFFEMLFGGVFALGYWSSCIGYIKLIFDAFHNLLHNWLTTSLVSALPAYTLSVLLAFLGEDTGKKFYNYLFDWDEYSQKLFLEFKLYTKYSLLAFGFICFITLYSQGSGAQLILDGFKDSQWDPIRQPLLIDCLIWLSILSFGALKDGFMTFVGQLAMHYGNEDAKAAIKLRNTTEVLAQTYLPILKPGVLSSSESQAYLSKYGIIASGVNQPAPIQELTTPKGNDRTCCGWFSFLGKSNTQGYKPLSNISRTTSLENENFPAPEDTIEEPENKTTPNSSEKRLTQQLT